VLLSVFDYLEKLKSPSSFRHIPDITDELIVYHLENICQRYQRKFESSDFKLGFFVCDLQFRAQKLAGNL
jgi:uncharacterized protein YihD (DUF1040 family)